VGRDAFGIVAPGALQAAAFEKDRRADAWAVFGGHSLDVSDQAYRVVSVFYISHGQTL